MIGVGSPGQRQYPDIESEPEDNLADGPTVAFGDLGQFGTSHRLAVGGQQREALVNDFVGGAELPDSPIPASDSVAAVLDEARPNARLLTQGLKLFESDIADTNQACSTTSVDDFHRTPGRPIVGGQTDALGRAVQQIRINDLGVQMFERAGERLFHLGRDGSRGIVRQALILTAPESELGLQEQIIADYPTSGDCG